MHARLLRLFVSRDRVQLDAEYHPQYRRSKNTQGTFLLSEIPAGKGEEVTAFEGNMLPYMSKEYVISTSTCLVNYTDLG